MRRRCVRYSPRLAALICERIARGQTMNSLQLAAGLPSTTSMRQWLTRHPDFRDMYEAACDQRDYDEMRDRFVDAEATGRRTRYCRDMAERICRRIAAGQSMADLRKARDLPATSTIYNWLGRYEEFRRMYGTACEQRADMLADEVMEIADAPSAEGGTPSRELLNWAKVRIAERKWRASKLAPLKYGLKSSPPEQAAPMSWEDVLLELE